MQHYQIPAGYELIPVAPHAAQVVPTCNCSQPQHQPQPQSQSNQGIDHQPSFFSLLVLGGIIGLIVILALPSGESGEDLKAENAQLRQEILWLQNRNAQLEHQLIGVYSSP